MTIRSDSGPASGRLVWFVTGASRGFGREIVAQALARGDSVAATARDPGRLASTFADAGERLLPLALDVTDEAAARRAVAEVVERCGRIDVLVNNAGLGLVGAVEEASDAEVRRLFDTNVFGLLAVTRAVLPVMREQGSGRVLNLSSVGGFTSMPGWGLYCATKFAVEGLSEAMHDELAPLGISVIAVEPGAFRTDFLDATSLQRVRAPLDDYAASAGRMREWADTTNHEQMGDPARAAAAMIAVATAPRPPKRLQLGSDCIARIEAKLADVARELDQWRAIALSTDRDDARGGAGRGGTPTLSPSP